MGRIAVLLSVLLIASGFHVHHADAQSGNTSEQKAGKANKKKSAEKKGAGKQTGAQSNTGQAVPMSGYRPDPQTNY
jgi:hypothetical protein